MYWRDLFNKLMKEQIDLKDYECVSFIPTVNYADDIETVEEFTITFKRNTERDYTFDLE